MTPATRVVLLGTRFGSSLAVEAAIRDPDQVSSVVSWEPVVRGSDYLTELRRMHAQMLDLWVCKISTANDDEREEILGSVYRRSFLNEIETLEMDFQALNQPHLVVDSAHRPASQNDVQSALLKRHLVEDNYSWNDLTQLETAWLRPQTVRGIVNQVDDLFDRLKRFGVLEWNTPNLKNQTVELNGAS